MHADVMVTFLNIEDKGGNESKVRAINDSETEERLIARVPRHYAHGVK